MHLTQDHEDQINNLYSRRLKVINSKDEERPGTSAGVAFVLNKELTNIENIEYNEIIPGRALMLKTRWHNNEELRILNVYAPNNPAEHHNFWSKIKEVESRSNNQQIDIMLGDFNLTEDPLDRAPARPDNENATDALRDLRESLNIHDNWRKTHPTSRLFTFYSNSNSYSRLDRIYSSPTHDKSLYDWSACTSAIPTDHKMILVRYAPPNTPHIGNGRWSWPLGLINDEKLLNNISQIGRIAQQKIETYRQPNESNIQTIWEDFKIKIRQEAKKATKENLYKINTRIKQLEKDIKLTLRNDDIDTNSDTRRQKADSKTYNYARERNGTLKEKQSVSTGQK
ncbi:Endonuclease/exonuclease/phosphatase [Suillus clintonianus]|uniref:Endonuclease/exonuclease/phosphatase n=1 Tax=Suillus clintonianus TaxID=1904413 RepID=UPI001B868B82|nr:Endonuclease/exonuclease/phosphatase [Suillus clintonianus]KAG2131745.1 Endonuclease/exonuclease/phosphatase [Suillus clintonianus]